MRQQAIDAGADFFFKKPVSMPDFLAAVQQLLGMGQEQPGPPPVSELVAAQPQTNRISETLSAARRSLAASAVLRWTTMDISWFRMAR